MALTAAQRKKAERQRDKDAGLKVWKAEIDDATRDALKRLTVAYGTRSQEKTFLKLISDAVERLDNSNSQSSAALPTLKQEMRVSEPCETSSTC